MFPKRNIQTRQGAGPLPQEMIGYNRTTPGATASNVITGYESTQAMPGLLLQPMPIYTSDNKLHRFYFVIVAKCNLTCEFISNEFQYNPRPTGDQPVNDWWVGCNANHNIRGCPYCHYAFNSCILKDSGGFIKLFCLISFCILCLWAMGWVVGHYHLINIIYANLCIFFPKYRATSG